MTRRPTRLSLASIGVAATLVVSMSALGSAQTAPPAPTPYPTPAAKPAAPTEGMTSYPDYGTVDCAAGTFNGLPYKGNLQKMEAPDAKTVVFTLCNPDVAFLSKVAFDSLAIDDAAYLIANMADPDHTILIKPNGTGPYMRTLWDRGNRMDMVANPNFWGPAALSPNLEFQWSRQSATRLLALDSGAVDGIDNPGKDDLPLIAANDKLKFYPRQGLNTFYLGMNNTVKPWTNQKVRQAIAMGIDRDRLVNNFYPPGSEVATYFTPCAIPNSCEGEAYYTFDAPAAKALLLEGLAEEGMDLAAFTPKIQFRDADRSYISGQPVIAQEIAAQLQDNLGITASLDQQESGTFLDNNAAGKLDGLFMLGWGADYPDTSNFLDYHFGAGTNKKFGTPYPDLVDAITTGGRSSNVADRAAAYGKANDLIKKYVPAVIISHAGSGTAFAVDNTGGYSSPLQERFDRVTSPDGTLVFMQNAEPLSLYCGDETDGETLRACHHIKESLYAYGGKTGLDPVPALATGCTPNEALTVWTCTLRDGVKFADGAALGADDVILSYALQWDNLNPLHVGRTGAFEYWDALIGQGKLNPPKPSS